MHKTSRRARHRVSETRAQLWVRLFVPLLTAALLTGGGLALLREWHTAPLTSALPPIVAAAPFPAASPFVVEVIFPDRMTVVTPEPPTPTPSPPKATPVGIDICTDLTRAGTLCKQPKPPKPAPTEVPDCPVDVGSLCVGTGKPVVWLPTATPDVTTYPPRDG
jgi:hypothetical protein